MRVIHAEFTESEVITLRDALSEETVRMRKHVRQMDDAICNGDLEEYAAIGAKKVLRELESLLTWAKDKAHQRSLTVQ